MSGKYQYDSLRDPAEYALRNWREQALPRGLPEHLRSMAISGDDINAGFRGRDIWFWDREGLLQLMHHLDTTDPAISGAPPVYLESVELYGKHKDRYRLEFAEARVDQAPLDTASISRQLMLDDPEITSRSLYYVRFGNRPLAAPAPSPAAGQAYLVVAPQSGASRSLSSWHVVWIIFLIIRMIFWLSRCAGDNY